LLIIVVAFVDAKDFKMEIKRVPLSPEAIRGSYNRRKIQRQMDSEIRKNNTIFKQMTKKLYSMLPYTSINSLETKQLNLDTSSITSIKGTVALG